MLGAPESVSGEDLSPTYRPVYPTAYSTCLISIHPWLNVSTWGSDGLPQTSFSCSLPCLCLCQLHSPPHCVGHKPCCHSWHFSVSHSTSCSSANPVSSVSKRYSDLTICHHSLCHHPLPGLLKCFLTGLLLLPLPPCSLLWAYSRSNSVKTSVLTVFLLELSTCFPSHSETSYRPHSPVHLISCRSLFSLSSRHVASLLSLEHALSSTPEPLYLLFALHGNALPADTSKAG